MNFPPTLHDSIRPGGVVEVAVPEAGPLQVCAEHLDPYHLGAVHLGAGQIRPFHVAPAEIDACEVAAAHDRVFEVDRPKIELGEIGTGEINALQDENDI